MWKLDRLGRNTRHLLEMLDDFKTRGIKFRSLRDGIATDPDSEVGGAMARAMVTVMSAFAQLNGTSCPNGPKPGWPLRPPRTEGRAARGHRHPREGKRAHELKTKGLKPADIGKIIGASRATVYRYLSLES